MARTEVECLDDGHTHIEGCRRLVFFAWHASEMARKRYCGLPKSQLFPKAPLQLLVCPASRTPSVSSFRHKYKQVRV